jgi:hypothetical protein
MYKIVENLIPTAYQNHIEHMIKKSSWVWHDETSYNITDPNHVRAIEIREKNKFITDLGQMTCPILDDGKIYSDNLNFFIPLLYLYADKADISITELVRVRANLLFQDKTYPLDHYNFPHVDHGKYSFLYYVNDSDGDTFLFDEFQKDTIPLNFNILERISPKKGKGIFFESDRYHASSNPKHTSIRLVLNFNFY